MNNKAYSDTAFNRPKNSRNCIPTNPTKRRWLFWGVPIGLVLIAGVAVGVAVGVSKSNQNATGSSGSSGSSAGGNGTSTSTGGGKNGTASSTYTSAYGIKGSGENGSTVAMAAGGSFVYLNEFGGNWAVDPSDPYSASRHRSSERMHS